FCATLFNRKIFMYDGPTSRSSSPGQCHKWIDNDELSSNGYKLSMGVAFDDYACQKALSESPKYNQAVDFAQFEAVICWIIFLALQGDCKFPELDCRGKPLTS